MDILILGGTGFIGEYLCKGLVGDDHNVTTAHFTNIDDSNKINNVNYLQADLNNKVSAIKEIINKVDILVIALQPNSLRMQKILSTIQKKSNLKKVLLLSTLLVYPSSMEKQSEQTVPCPATKYEQEKIKEEKLLSEFTKNNNIQLTIARLGNVYGDVKNKGIINYIFLSILKGDPLIINGDGKQIRDYIFVEDAVNYLKLLIEKKQNTQNEIINLCSGVGVSIIEIVKIIEKIVKKKIQYKFGKPVIEKKCVIGENLKIVKLLNRQPKFNIKKGLNKTYLNYLKNTGLTRLDNKT